MPLKMTEPLRLNYEFARVYKRGVFISGRYVVLHVFLRPKNVRSGARPVPSDKNRLGVAASRKVKNAVTRNRARRLLRESYRLMENELEPGYDLILTMKDIDPLPAFSEVQKEMLSLFRRAHIVGRGSGE